MMRRIFSPPYRWLPALLFAFFALCFALHPFSPFYTHHLADPDDYMRLNEVVAWLRGQGWHDLSVPRMSPGGHTIVHWSRLIDMPIALIALPFIPLLGMENAALAASFIVPLIWFAVLLGAVAALGRGIVGAQRATIACVMIFFMPFLLFQYTPGRVDHHGIQALIALFGLLSLDRILADDRPRLFVLLAALFFACGFWIGAEALPWAGLFILALAMAAAWQGGRMARDAAWFGLALPLATVSMIPAALPVAEYSSRALSWFSPAYAIFAALAGAVLILGWVLTQRSGRVMRMTAYPALGIIAAALFLILVPSARDGIFADYDKFDAGMALDNINEATPLAQKFHINPYISAAWLAAVLTFSRFLFLPLMGLAGCIIGMRREKKFIWLAQFIFLFAASLLTLFWQLRVGIFMEAFSIVPLTWLLCRWWDELKWGLWERPLFWAEIGVFLLLGPLPVLILPAIAARTPLYPDLVLFPVARGAPVCDLSPVLPALKEEKTVHTIMNSSDTGPQLLFETQHNVVSGNFDVPGNADAYTFFHALHDDDARAAALRWKADLVLICKAAPTLYLGKDYYAPSHTALRPGKDGMLRLVNQDKDQPLAERLINGPVPAWLKSVELPGQSDYLLFRIVQ